MDWKKILKYGLVLLVISMVSYYLIKKYKPELLMTSNNSITEGNIY